MLGDCLCNIAYFLIASKFKEIYRCKYFYSLDKKAAWFKCT